MEDSAPGSHADERHADRVDRTLKELQRMVKEHETALNLVTALWRESRYPLLNLNAATTQLGNDHCKPRSVAQGFSGCHEHRLRGGSRVKAHIA